MAKKATQAQPNIIKRPPIVVIMGHIDHGKSTLLDYIRKTNVVEGEAGGITQHLSAYEATHTTSEGSTEQITFLDTPGHAAFQKMRFRGADVADVAVLIVSAEDGVMPQTLEALKCIQEADIPFVVAINKIDKPGADLAKTQASLIENGIYIEGMGGDIPWTGVSAKSGEGVSELLDLVILAADLADLTGDTNAPATGKVIESHLDTKRGNTGTLIVTNGTLKGGSFVVSGNVFAPVRIMEDHLGKPIKEASLSKPIGIVGFTEVPEVGADFYTVGSKKEAEKATEATESLSGAPVKVDRSLPIVPILIKADALGSIEAIEHELDKFESERIAVRVIDTGVGDITQNDVQNVSATEDAIIVGFNVKTERAASDLAERLGVEIDNFDVIYNLSEWLETALKERTPKMEEEVQTGVAKVLKHFSTQKNILVLGARMEEGELKLNQKAKIMRRDIEVGRGTIRNLQSMKKDVDRIDDGEFGLQLETRADIAPGDYIHGFDLVIT